MPKFKCDILSNFQTMCPSSYPYVSTYIHKLFNHFSAELEEEESLRALQNPPAKICIFSSNGFFIVQCYVKMPPPQKCVFCADETLWSSFSKKTWITSKTMKGMWSTSSNSQWCWWIILTTKRLHIVWKLVKMSHLKFWILAFSTTFCLIKTDLSGNTVWPQASGFQKLAKMDHFWHF